MPGPFTVPAGPGQAWLCPVSPKLRCSTLRTFKTCSRVTYMRRPLRKTTRASSNRKRHATALTKEDQTLGTQAIKDKQAAPCIATGQSSQRFTRTASKCSASKPSFTPTGSPMHVARGHRRLRRYKAPYAWSSARCIPSPCCPPSLQRNYTAASSCLAAAPLGMKRQLA